MDERTELVVFAVLAVVGAAVFAGVGIAASTDLPVSHGKAEAQETARTFLQSQGYDVDGYRTNTIFTSDDETGTYIQRKLPLGEARRAAQTHAVYVWEVRFYRPLNQTEFRVHVDPITGDVVGLDRRVPDEAPGARLSKAAARQRARAFLEARGHDLATLQPVRNASTDHPNRRDHVFAWKKRNSGVADAPVTVTVEIQGDRVGAYSRDLDVPDAFSHQFETQQNRNELLGSIATFLFILLVLLTLGIGVRYYRRGRFDLRKALYVGLVVGVVVFLQQLNGLPGALHHMPTTTTPVQFVLQVVVGAVLSAVVVGGVAGVLFGAGTRIAEDYLGKSQIGNADPETTVRTLKVSTVRGFCVGWILLGYVTLFYYLGARYFDVWMPVGTPYTSAMSTFLPVLAVLWVGLLPAVTEELVFRVVGISLGSRYLRSAWVAVVVTAMVWAFGHSQYVVLPSYARFVELTVAGIVVGWLYLRYDFVTVVSYHFTLNASLTAVPMLLADLPFVVLNGAVGLVVASLPLLVGVGTIGYDRARPGHLAALLEPERVPAEDVLDVLKTTDEHVLTTSEVATELGVADDVARRTLEELRESGDVDGKDVGGGNAVWWT